MASSASRMPAASVNRCPASASSAREFVSRPPMTSTIRNAETMAKTTTSRPRPDAAADRLSECGCPAGAARPVADSVIVSLSDQRLAPFTHKEDADPKRRNRVGPPPAEHRVQADSRQDNDREVPARLGLLGIGGQCAAAELRGSAPAFPSPPTHHPHGYRGGGPPA